MILRYLRNVQRARLCANAEAESDNDNVFAAGGANAVEAQQSPPHKYYTLKTMPSTSQPPRAEYSPGEQVSQLAVDGSQTVASAGDAQPADGQRLATPSQMPLDSTTDTLYARRRGTRRQKPETSESSGIEVEDR